MLKMILSIAGKPGLFKLVSQGKNMLIVESIADKKRIPVYAKDKVVSLGDIAIYTEDEEKPLYEVFNAIREKEEGKIVEINTKDKETAFAYFEKVLPTFDKDRVYANDIKKIISWYNILTADGMTDFSPKEETEETVAIAADPITLTITDVDGNEYTDEVTIAYNVEEENTTVTTFNLSNTEESNVPAWISACINTQNSKK